VQVMDRLEIPRPCIDAPSEGYNVEWSQELSLEDSARQYATAWLLVHVLAARGLAGEPGAPGTIFDGSVGYDLAGIRSAGVARFLDTMGAASALLDSLRAELPPALRAAADVPVPGRIVDTVTLSSFHGCPPDEIERIVEHLFSRHHVHVVVKLNPTLLGFGEVDGLVRGRLGWPVTLDREAFEKDLQWSDALPLLDRLAGAAERAGRSLGVKFTNTLVVRNTRGRLEGEHVYLSGAPLHVVAVTLAHRFTEATGGRFPVSFSAGIDAENFPDAVAAGFAPVTTCTDLLRPTGYRRLARYLKALEADMDRLGARDLDAYRVARAGKAPDAAAAARANLAALAARVAGDPRYSVAVANVAPSARDPLPVLDCESCNNCVLVCPNAAFFSVATPPAWLERGRAKQEKQWAVFADACNECGNCDTFCPQEGGPHRVKPRWSAARGTFEAAGIPAPELAELAAAARVDPGWVAPEGDAGR